VASGRERFRQAHIDPAALRADHARPQTRPAAPVAAGRTGKQVIAHAAPGEQPRWWRDQRRRRMLGVADLLATAAIGITAAAVVGETTAWAALAIPVGPLTAKLLGLYDQDHRAIRHLTVDELPTLSVWAGITTILALILAPGEVTLEVAALVALGATVVSFVLRATARWAWRRLTPPERALVVGDGAPAEAIRRKIELFPDMHLVLAGVESPAEHVAAIDGNETEAMTAMDRALQGVDRMVLAWPGAEPRLIQLLVEHCRRLEVKLSVVSPFRGKARPALRLSQVADLPLLEYNTWDVPRSTRALKRAFDIAASSLGLVVLAPVLAMIALAIKLDDRGPVLFRQQRVGRNGHPFTLIKFRSMCADAEEKLNGLVDLERLESPMFKLRSDPRITRVGRRLRRFSFDELPQLINVLRGEMSLVGPRPEEVAVAKRYLPEHAFRFEVKPGVTGPMQVFGRGELTFEERLAVEIDYVENLSITRDLGLLAQTLPAVIRGTGAF
jgi:exopolysaccharide biosynthesis polyprenyl glycosylphosphotransferase